MRRGVHVPVVSNDDISVHNDPRDQHNNYLWKFPSYTINTQNKFQNTQRFPYV
jgi:hypothetical protein